MKLVINIICMLIWIGFFVLHAFTDYIVHGWVVGYSLLICAFLYMEKVVDDIN